MPTVRPNGGEAASLDKPDACDVVCEQLAGQLVEAVPPGLAGERLRQCRANASATGFAGHVDAAFANACVARPVAVGSKSGPPDDPTACFGDKKRKSISCDALAEILG